MSGFQRISGDLAMASVSGGLQYQMGKAFCHAPNCGVEFECRFMYVPSRNKSFPMEERCESCRGALVVAEPVKRDPVVRDMAKVEAQWKDMCKGYEKYQNVDHSTLPEFLQKLYREWTPKVFERPGLIFIGGTGTHKSRTSFALVERAFYAGKTVQIQSPGSFFEQCLGSFETSIEHARWKAKLIACDILLFDDFTQSHWTDRTGAVLYDVIEARCRAGKTLITSTNYRGMNLLERLPKIHATQIRRRLNDMCTLIDTGEAKQEQLKF